MIRINGLSGYRWYLKALKAEIASGNGAVMLPLYAELVRNALTDEAVASTIRFDDLDVAPKLAFMLAISQPSDTATLSAFGRNADALQVAELLGGIKRGEIDSDTVSALKNMAFDASPRCCWCWN